MDLVPWQEVRDGPVAPHNFVYRGAYRFSAWLSAAASFYHWSKSTANAIALEYQGAKENFGKARKGFVALQDAYTHVQKQIGWEKTGDDAMGGETNPAIKEASKGRRERNLRSSGLAMRWLGIPGVSRRHVTGKPEQTMRRTKYFLRGYLPMGGAYAAGTNENNLNHWGDSQTTIPGPDWSTNRSETIGRYFKFAANCWQFPVVQVPSTVTFIGADTAANKALLIDKKPQGFTDAQADYATYRLEKQTITVRFYIPSIEDGEDHYISDWFTLFHRRFVSNADNPHVPDNGDAHQFWSNNGVTNSLVTDGYEHKYGNIAKLYPRSKAGRAPMWRRNMTQHTYQFTYNRSQFDQAVAKMTGLSDPTDDDAMLNNFDRFGKTDTGSGESELPEHFITDQIGGLSQGAASDIVQESSADGPYKSTNVYFTVHADALVRLHDVQFTDD